MVKKLTRKEWEELELKELEREERIEEECERLANTKPIADRLNLARNIIKK